MAGHFEPVKAIWATNKQDRNFTPKNVCATLFKTDPSV